MKPIINIFLFLFAFYVTQAFSQPINGRVWTIPYNSAGEAKIAKTLRVFQDETSSQFIVLSLKQKKPAKIIFSKMEYEWAERSIQFLRDDLSLQNLSPYLKAVEKSNISNALLAIELKLQEMRNFINTHQKTSKRLETCLKPPEHYFPAPRPVLDPGTDNFLDDLGSAKSEIEPGLKFPVLPSFRYKNEPISMPAKVKSAMGWTDPNPNDSYEDLQLSFFEAKNPIDWKDPYEELSLLDGCPASFSAAVNESTVSKVAASDGVIPGSAGIFPSSEALYCNLPHYIERYTALNDRYKRFETFYIEACQKGLVLISTDAKYNGDRFAQFLDTIDELPTRIMQLPVMAVNFEVQTEPNQPEKDFVNQLIFPGQWRWGTLSAVEPRNINRVPNQVLDSLGTVTASVDPGTIKITTPYTYYGALGLYSKFGSPLKFVTADVRAWSEDSQWFFYSLGLSLEFTLSQYPTN